ncbi:hypothetical protein GCM10010441_25080 [Kitasatospora paracochleata]|uniref:ESX-1 secretion-associated protein n=1 Tax=Kitasatospora paracochleata TaxID=58354 RepID=A0ABT1J0V5_9ACTN|nr:hypothetical protein [Kitasatospora paracochleata]MCP2311065.1 hypothetical protein [Kitasatospora paracochleata]
MSTDVSKAADTVAKLRAQADKFAAPLAEAEAALAVAQDTQQARCAERAAEHDQEFLTTWSTQAADRSARGNELHTEFLELLSAEQWLRAYVAHRAERYKREKVIIAAQNAQASASRGLFPNSAGTTCASSRSSPALLTTPLPRLVPPLRRNLSPSGTPTLKRRTDMTLDALDPGPDGTYPHFPATHRGGRYGRTPQLACRCSTVERRCRAESSRCATRGIPADCWLWT